MWHFFLKNAWLPLILFLDSNNPCQDLLFPRSYKPRRNISVLAGTAVKGTMSVGFCSFFVITVLIIQLVTLSHAQNVAFTVKGRYQVNFRIGTKLLLVLSDFSKTQRNNLKTLAQLFQIAIHFHPGHPQLNTY